jgi:hypothetical protein
MILCIVQAVIRREEGGDHDDHEVTAADMRRAMRTYQRLGDEGGKQERVTRDVDAPPRIETLPSARKRP